MGSAYKPRLTVPQWYDKPLEMSIPDIIKNYREAKSPSKQIDILADLNGTAPSRITWILSRAGCQIPPKKMPRPPRNPDTPDYVALWEQSEDARICDEYKSNKENEKMSECIVAAVPRKSEPRQTTETTADIVPAEKPRRHSDAVYTDVVDIFWNTYMNARYGIALDHDDIMRLIGLSDIARAAAGGAE